MALIPSVGTGQIITPTWGNGIRDRTIQYFATVAEIKSTWSVAPSGAFAYAADEDSVCVMKAGTWRWWTKDFAVTTGNTSYLTYAAGATAGSSSSALSIVGRTVTLRGSAAVAAPAVSGNIVLFSMAVAYRIATSMNLPASGYGTNYTWAVRTILQTTGDFQFFWGGAGTALANVLHHTTWTLPDLVAA